MILKSLLIFWALATVIGTIVIIWFVGKNIEFVILLVPLLVIYKIDSVRKHNKIERHRRTKK